MMYTVGQIRRDLTLKQAWNWAKDQLNSMNALHELIDNQQFAAIDINDHNYPTSFYSFIKQYESGEE